MAPNDVTEVGAARKRITLLERIRLRPNVILGGGAKSIDDWNSPGSCPGVRRQYVVCQRPQAFRVIHHDGRLVARVEAGLNEDRVAADELSRDVPAGAR